MAENKRLRITFIAGGLTKGGAEKQFLYMLQALRSMGVSLQVLTLTRGEYHEGSLSDLGIEPVYIGSSPAERGTNIVKAARAFRPHFLQASHFFASLYAGAAGRITGIPSIGAIRSDLYLDLEGVGKLGPWALRAPSVLIANSYKAQQNARQIGLDPRRIFVVQNVIDLEDFDRRRTELPNPPLPGSDRVRAVTVARLVPVKRLERFLQALSIARQMAPNLEGVIVGGGPEETALRAIASDLGLLSNSMNSRVPTGSLRSGVRFLGERHDIPQILSQCHICVMTSDREGFPNILLESMAAGLPLLSTPAGESPAIVQEGINGFLVPFDDVQVLADHLTRLAKSPAERQSIGYAGRKMVENQYGFPRLKRSLMDAYREIARRQHHRAALEALDAQTGINKSPSPVGEVSPAGEGPESNRPRF